ncbi:MAG TPA: PspC domain-containing protein, partial [Solirubrobacteraceae bacterium]|nr:PspC domain-containing protein [Solirubrobacteraceae bacterium]
GSDRIVVGVAGGLGRHFDIDPLLFRLGFVVLSLFGGGGLILYLVLAAIVPSDGVPGDPQHAGRGRAAAIALAVVAALVLFPLVGGGLVMLSPLLLIAAVAVLAYRAAGGSVDPRLAHAAVVVLALMAALALGAGAATAVAFGGGTIVAAIVLGLGVVLIAAAFAGGARWLIAPALLLAVPLALVSAAGISFEGGVGQREYRPGSLNDLRDEYRLGVGELVLDLRDVDFGAGTTTVRTDVGVGATRVLLPRGVCVASEVELGLGEADVLDRESHGVDVTGAFAEARSDPSLPTLRLRSEVGVGEVEVTRHELGGRFVFDGDDEEVPCGP